MAKDSCSGMSAIFSIEEWAQTSRRGIFLSSSGASRIPDFLIEKQPAGSGLWESIRALCARGSFAQPATLLPFRKSFLTQKGPSSSLLGVSLLLHSLAVAGLIYVPRFIPESPAPLALSERFDTMIYYDVPVEHSEKELPSIAPPGEAGRPGEGTKPEQIPNLGSAVSLGGLTVISKPSQPDNHHQTIVQPLSPPEMRITQDVKLPNVILGNLSAPRAPLTFAESAMPKPERADHQVAAAPAPNVTDPAHSDAALQLAANEPVVAKPLLAMALQKPVQQARTGSGQASQGTAAPVPTLADQTHSDGVAQLAANEPVIAKPLLAMALQKPVQQARTGGGQASQGTAAPVPTVADQTRNDGVAQLAANEPAVAKPLPPMALQRPVQQGRAAGGQGAQGGAAPVLTVADQTHNDGMAQLAGNDPVVAKPLPPMTLQKPVQQGRAGNGQALQGADAAPVLTEANGLMVVSVDPSAAGSRIAVPPGNRWGDFAIAPGQRPGSPGGDPASGGADAGTTGQNGAGGEKSVGIGARGTGGGGGPSSASLGPISVKGNLTGANEPLLLTSSVAAEMVYPLPVSVVAKLRQNRMVVSAGSMGGGGLNIYGALEGCGKIYTIFLPMPGASWTMQFCQKSDATAPAKPQTQARVIQLESPIVPPDPDSDSRFDFKRLPLPPEKGTNKAIVLKGVLGEDGTIQNLEVFQGVLAEMDQAAQLAFSRWKFKPAVRADKPISVEILVGIPAEVPPIKTGGAPSQQQPPQRQEPAAQPLQQ